MRKTEGVNDWAGESRERRKPVVFWRIFHAILWTSLDMYTENAQTAGHHRFLQQPQGWATTGTLPPPCQHCVHREQPYGHHGGPGYQPASARQPDHPSLDCRRDVQAPRVKNVGGRGFLVDRVERSGHRSPQRRPVFAAPGPCTHSDDLSQVCPWELNPAQWSYALEPGVRHYPSVREQCGCVVQADARAHPFNAGIPHPLPHLQVKGQGYRHRRTVRYVCVEEEEEEGCGCNSGELSFGATQSPIWVMYTCRMATVDRGLWFFEGGEERDSHQDRSRLKGGSEEGCTMDAVALTKASSPLKSHKNTWTKANRGGPASLPQASAVQSPRKSTTTSRPPAPGFGGGEGRRWGRIRWGIRSDKWWQIWRMCWGVWSKFTWRWER